MAPPSFSIAAPPSTDIWRKPPSTNALNAPTAHAATGKLNSFASAKIRIRLPPRPKLIQYDQGGILLSLSRPSSDSHSTSASGSGSGSAPAAPADSQWLKSGIEFYNGKPWVGTVACDRWADWSIADLCSKDVDCRPTITLLLERSSDELGRSLWIYALSADEAHTEGKEPAEKKETRTPLREVNWIFADEPDEVELSVSAYAARPQKPTAGEGQEIEVLFDQFEVRWK